MFNGTEYCLEPYMWNDRVRVKSEMEALGATCNSTYESDYYLDCYIGSVRCNVDVSQSTICYDNQSICEYNSTGAECYGR